MVDACGEKIAESSCCDSVADAVKAAEDAGMSKKCHLCLKLEDLENQTPGKGDSEPFKQIFKFQQLNFRNVMFFFRLVQLS